MNNTLLMYVNKIYITSVHYACYVFYYNIAVYGEMSS